MGVKARRFTSGLLGSRRPCLHREFQSQLNGIPFKETRGLHCICTCTFSDSHGPLLTLGCSEVWFLVRTSTDAFLRHVQISLPTPAPKGWHEPQQYTETRRQQRWCWALRSGLWAGALHGVRLGRSEPHQSMPLARLPLQQRPKSFNMTPF